MRAMDPNSRKIRGLSCEARETRAGVRSSAEKSENNQRVCWAGLDVEQQLADHGCIIDPVDLGSCLDAYSHLYIGPRNGHRRLYPPSVA
jgi:hypothetical protein